MKQHELKTDPEVFQAVWDRKKTFEIRKNDRDFQPGEMLILQETQHSGEEMRNGKPLIYTGRKVLAEAGYILKGPCYGLQEDWCIISIEILDRCGRTEGAEERIRLRTSKEQGGDTTLDGYLFTDAEHAIRWLSNPRIDANSRYSIEIVEADKAERMRYDDRHHGNILGVIRRMTVEEFLKEYQKA